MTSYVSTRQEISVVENDLSHTGTSPKNCREAKVDYIDRSVEMLFILLTPK